MMMSCASSRCPPVTLLATIDIDATVSDAEGIEINPANGNILIADDLVGSIGTLFEFTRTGVLVRQWDMADLLAGTSYSNADPLGLALDRGRGELYVAQGTNNRVDVFRFGTGEPVAVSIAPPGTLLLLSTVLVGMGLMAMRRRRRTS